MFAPGNHKLFKVMYPLIFGLKLILEILFYLQMNFKNLFFIVVVVLFAVFGQAAGKLTKEKLVRESVNC
jgi:hypothetical protein